MRFRRRGSESATGVATGLVDVPGGPRPLESLSAGVQEELRLMATQLAARGQSREEAEVYLGERFQVTGLDAVLAGIFGERAPWG